jgi:hypothetical protein
MDPHAAEEDSGEPAEHTLMLGGTHLMLHELAETRGSTASHRTTRWVRDTLDHRPCQLRVEWSDQQRYFLQQNRQGRKATEV